MRLLLLQLQTCVKQSTKSHANVCLFMCRGPHSHAQKGKGGWGNMGDGGGEGGSWLGSGMPTSGWQPGEGVVTLQPQLDTAVRARLQL